MATYLDRIRKCPFGYDHKQNEVEFSFLIWVLIFSKDRNAVFVITVARLVVFKLKIDFYGIQKKNCLTGRSNNSKIKPRGFLNILFVCVKPT